MDSRRQDADLRLDLDLAAEAIEARRAHWSAEGFQLGDLTWRDVAAERPHSLVGRADAVDPDSVGVRAIRPPVACAIVVFDGRGRGQQGGWAEVTAANLDTAELQVDAPDIVDIEAFELLLDTIFTRWSTG
jgi:hypothetical protein